MNKFDNKEDENKGHRIAKIIARSGYCSRRQAEMLIFENRVSVAGKIVNNPATSYVDIPIIEIDGKRINSIRPEELYIYYKPSKTLCSAISQKDMPTIYEYLPRKLENIIYVGRLDLYSEGLLLLTNDGKLANYLSSPKNNFIRVYEVKIFGRITDPMVKQLARGITIDDISYKPVSLEIIQENTSNSWIRVFLTEGKNREIRRIFEHFGIQISRLIRVEYGPFSLGNLKPNEVRKVNLEDYEISADYCWKI